MNIERNNMNREEWDIRLLEYWQGESLSPEEIRAVENWLGRKSRITGIMRIYSARFYVSVG